MGSQSDDRPTRGGPPNSSRDTSTTRYDEPFGWWGYHWSAPEPRSLVWLIRAGSLDTRLAAFLSLAIEFQRSIIVVAEPQEAGKTTLLTALLDFRRPDTQPIYLRGWYERFTFLEETSPEHAYLLCNEISAHLPTYLWGQGVRRIFEAGTRGYAFVTTMHATSAADAIDLLMRYPLEVPPEHIAAIDLVISLGVGYVNDRLIRRVLNVEEVTPDADSFRIQSISGRELLRTDLEHRTGRMVACVARWGNMSDDDAGRILSRRERLLQSWLENGLIDVEDVRRTISSIHSN